jgi:hypothetical protein
MGQLDLAAGVAFFEREVKADEGEREADVTGRSTAVLGSVGVHHVLMNEFTPAVRQRVGREFVEELLALVGIRQPTAGARCFHPDLQDNATIFWRACRTSSRRR